MTPLALPARPTAVGADLDEIALSAGLAAQCARQSATHLTVAYADSPLQIIRTLLEAAAYLSAVHHLFTDRPQQIDKQIDKLDTCGGKHKDSAVEARRQAWYASFVATHLLAVPNGAAAANPSASPRHAIATLLAALAAERLHHAVSQLAELPHNPVSAREREWPR